ncbi:MAG: chemotaxis protein CheD [Phycisphaeraceae bacterium]|nr:chemotaxis protein CheD [Phycisphaeraceae bacterium]
MLQVVGISDLKTSRDGEDVLITYSLGSCIGVSLWDPVARVGGLMHALLPLSRMDPAKATTNPAMFADTGVIELIQRVQALGAQKNRLVVKVAGAGTPLNSATQFNIGERNYTVLRKVLWKNDILLAAEEVGGNQPRTLSLRIDDGRTFIKSKGVEHEF